ncbi:MAG: DUF86 domain-containing protein [Candidatus Bipolaricaulia bacterium]
MGKLDFAKLKSRLEELRERYELLKSWQSMSKEEFLNDPRNNRSVLRLLQEAIETCISTAHMIVATQGYGRPESYAEAFALLAQHSVLDKEFSAELEKMVGFRNRVIHRYWDIDFEQVYRIFQERLEDFKRFEREILKFVEQLPED